jgi:hypothetical protein
MSEDSMSRSFVPIDLSDLITKARRDDWYLHFVGSDIRCMLAEIERLRDEIDQLRGADLTNGERDGR